MRKDLLIAYRKQEEKDRDMEYNQTWVVFDKDSFTKERFSQAIQLANSNNIKVVFSNQCFDSGIYCILITINPILIGINTPECSQNI